MNNKSRKDKKEKFENNKNQIIMTLLLMANRIGLEKKEGLSEEFMQDCLKAVDLMNFDYVLYMLKKEIPNL